MLDYCLTQVKHDPTISAQILSNIEKQDPAVFSATPQPPAEDAIVKAQNYLRSKKTSDVSSWRSFRSRQNEIALAKDRANSDIAYKNERLKSGDSRKKSAYQATVASADFRDKGANDIDRQLIKDMPEYAAEMAASNWN